MLVISSLAGNPAGFLSALGGNIVGTIATSGTITGSATPGPGALVVVTAAPGFSKIQLTCTNPDVSFVSIVLLAIGISKEIFIIIS